MVIEQDRGAYTPQSDAPLAFDARKARGGGGTGSTILILSGIVLMGVIIAVLLVYRHGARHADQPPMVVGAPVGQTKEAPPSSAQPADETAGLQVYKTEAPSASAQHPAPTFIAPPEQPKPLPPPPAPKAAPTPAVVASPLRPAQEPSPVAAAPAVSPAPLAKPVVAPKPAVAAKPLTAPKPAATPTTAGGVSAAKPAAPVATATPVAATKPKPKAAAAPTALVLTTPATGGGAAAVQIGAFSSEALADKGWRDAGAAVPGGLAGKSKKVEVVSKDGTTFYRTSVTGFASRDAAASFCTALKAAGHSCFVR